jgi:hypothetical protein
MSAPGRVLAFRPPLPTKVRTAAKAKLRRETRQTDWQTSIPLGRAPTAAEIERVTAELHTTIDLLSVVRPFQIFQMRHWAEIFLAHALADPDEPLPPSG